MAGSTVFVATMLLMFVASASYHAARPGPAKTRLRRLDHAVIFLFIAGSYTPFALGALYGAWGWTLFGLIWGLAMAGIVFKLYFTGRFKWLSTGIYLAMGWLIVFAAGPLMAPP